MRRSHGGFSLLETLAAMLLLAVCFGALVQATRASMALDTRAMGYTQASLWAQGLLDRLFVTDFPSEGEHVGAFDATYRWSMRISTPADAVQETTVPVHLYRIELTVRWTESGRPVQLDVATSRVVSTRHAANGEMPTDG